MKKALLASLILLLCSCGESPSKLEDLNTLEMTFPNGNKVVAEMMVTDLDVTRGLMFRDSMAQDRGMILIHPKQKKWQNWMRNVRFPLDVVWLDRDRRVVEIVRNTEPCPASKTKDCPLYGGSVDSQFVLELNAGVVAKQGLKVGDTIAF